MAEVVEATLADEARTLAEATRRALVECVLVGTDEARARSAWAAAASTFEAQAPATRGLASVVTTTFVTGLGAFADFETWSEAAIELMGALL
jgi:hypothetical protein